MKGAGLIVTGAIAAVWLGLAGLALSRVAFGPAFDEPADFGKSMTMALFGLALGGFAAFCFYRIWTDRPRPV